MGTTADLADRCEAAGGADRGYPWQPIDMVTPAKWYRFFGRRIGNTTLGFAAAACPTAFFIGFELITGSSRGFAIGLGPLWLGVAALRAKEQPQ